MTLSTILILIKDSGLRQLYHELLAKEEWEVVISSDVASALLKMVHSNIHFILLDKELPSAECTKFLTMLASRDLWVDIPIVVINYSDSIQELKELTTGLKCVVPVDTGRTTPGDVMNILKELRVGRLHRC